jgi:hypothetical protein
MGGVEALTKALSSGGEILWDPPDKPKIVAPKASIKQIRGDIQAVREVLRRAVLFRSQIDGDGPFKLFILPEGKDSDAGCISCAVDIPVENIRCPLCQTAAWIALDITPSI